MTTEARHLDESEPFAEGPRLWNRHTLQQIVEGAVGNRQFSVVSNREPYTHRLEAGEVIWERSVSGVVTALEPVVRVCGGSWVAHGSGNADRETVDANDRVQVPPDAPEYTLRRVWINKTDENGYYYGFANQALWPLCHIAYERPMFDGRDWEAYVRVNRSFADAILAEAAGRDAIVLIQDYHFCLLPRMLREANPRMLIAQFWHIPWPNREVFRVCPWQVEILDGLLGNDLLGFHIQQHSQNFVDTVATTIEARVESEHFSITRGGNTTRVRQFPISLDIEAVSEQALSDETRTRSEHLRQLWGLVGQKIMLGVDRIDYTKGVPERLRAVDRLFENHPEYIGKVCFLQLSAPSRTRLPRYQALTNEVESLVEEINWKYQQDRWLPVVYKRGQHPWTDVLACYCLADVCVTTSLHDGMNLVAKEYVAARADGDGVLVLSRFTGSAQELEQCLQINPYAIDDVADTLQAALAMDETERRSRMQALRETVWRNNIYRWAGKMVDELGRIARLRSLDE
jgi:trehalose 6-phosphate synthase